MGDKYGIGLDSMNIAEFELSRGNLDEAIAAVRTSTDRFKEIGDQWMLAGALENAAQIAVMRDKPSVAARLFGFTDAVVARCGLPRGPSNERDHERTMERVRERLEPGEIRRGHQSFERAGRSRPRTTRQLFLNSESGVEDRAIGGRAACSQGGDKRLLDR